MKILITGGSGFIGSHLIKYFKKEGHEVCVLDLRPSNIDGVNFIELNLMEEEPTLEAFKNVDAVVHLAGVNIFKRWNKETKKLIMDSRIIGTRNLVNSLRRLNQKPKVLVSASAVGYYGDGGDTLLKEDMKPGNDFLASVCSNWEKEVKAVEKFGMRSVQIRTAPVLSSGGGMLKKMLLPYRLGLGGPLGKGNQWFPWIHISDLVKIYELALQNKDMSGPYNAVAPKNTRQKEFSLALAKTLKKPHFIRIPKFLLKIVLGEVSDIALFSQRIDSKKISDAGFNFSFPDINFALRDLFR